MQFHVPSTSILKVWRLFKLQLQFQLHFFALSYTVMFCLSVYIHTSFSFFDCFFKLIGSRLPYSFWLPYKSLILGLIYTHKCYQRFDKAIVRLFLTDVNVLALIRTFFSFLVVFYWVIISLQNSFVTAAISSTYVSILIEEICWSYRFRIGYHNLPQSKKK